MKINVTVPPRIGDMFSFSWGLYIFCIFNVIHFMAAFWAVFTFGGSGLAITAHGWLDIKQVKIYTNSNLSA
jgi:hypothetical protein